jgi:hypothetical protein
MEDIGKQFIESSRTSLKQTRVSYRRLMEKFIGKNDGYLAAQYIRVGIFLAQKHKKADISDYLLDKLSETGLDAHQPPSDWPKKYIAGCLLEDAQNDLGQTEKSFERLCQFPPEEIAQLVLKTIFFAQCAGRKDISDYLRAESHKHGIKRHWLRLA